MIWDQSGPQWKPLTTSKQSIHWTVVHLSWSGQHPKVFQKCIKNPSRECRPQLFLSVNDSKIRQTGQNSVHEIVPRLKPQLTKKEHTRPFDVYPKTSWWFPTSVKVFRGRCASCYIWHKTTWTMTQSTSPSLTYLKITQNEVGNGYSNSGQKWVAEIWH